MNRISLTDFFAGIRRLTLLVLLFLFTTNVWASGDHDHGHGDEHEHDSEADHGDESDGRVRIGHHIAAQAGVRTVVASGGPIRQIRLLYGRIVHDPRQISRVRARFPGPIIRILPALGDRVKAGETVAEVEANESLRRYSLAAPIAGTVVAVHANVGDFAAEQPLLTIANQDRLWAEFRVYSQDRALVKTDMPVQLRHEEKKQNSKVELLVPALGSEPYGVVRVPIDNRNGDWAPGMLVEGDLVVSAADVALLVDNRALQDVRDATVVFIQVDDEYEIRPLELGRTDGRVTEVLGGLNVGDRYVVENSYLLKADLEKSGAAHDH